MNSDSLGIFNAIVATGGAAAAIAATWVSVLVYRRMVDIGSPDVSAALEDGARLVIIVDNGTPCDWEIAELLLGRGIHANLVENLNTYDPTYGTPILRTADEMDALLLRGAVPINAPIHSKSAGVSAAMGRGDRKRLVFHFSASQKSLTFKLILVSREGKPRKVTVPIKRMLTANSAIATD